MTTNVRLLVANTQICTKVPSDGQVLKVFRILNDQALLVGQVECTNKAVARRDVGERLLRVHLLEVVDHIGEVERPVHGFHCRIIDSI